VLTDPILPHISILRTGFVNESEPVWPFGKLSVPSLRELNSKLLEFDIDERLVPRIKIKAIIPPKFETEDSLPKRYEGSYRSIKDPASRDLVEN